MAKKISADSAPEPEKEELDYKELHDTSLRDIASDKTPEKEPEPTKEEVVEPVKEPVKEPDVVIDPAKMAEDIAARTAATLAAAEAEEKRLETEKLAELNKKDAATEYLEKAKAEGHEPTWTEAMTFLEERASTKALEHLKAEQAAAVKAQEEQQAAEKRASDELQTRFNQHVDTQLEEMYSEGKLTRIKDANNPSDPGIMERKALFSAMMEVNAKRATENKNPIASLKEIFYEHYKKPDAQPAGADAPVSMGTNNAIKEEEPEIDYVKDISSKPWSFFRTSKQ